jgi:Zn-dependent protease
VVDISHLIQTITINALPVLFAITLHEAAHGYAAKQLGDTTAWALGRVTLNPVNHIDPVGTILMPLLIYFATSGSFLFGFAKPVPVQFGRLNNPKRDMVWVALAGPLMNLFQAFVWGLALYTLLGLGMNEAFFLEMCKAGILVNIVMFAFNLFPVPPLDGGRVLVGVLPQKMAYSFSRIEPYGFYIVMALVFLNVINPIWMSPIMSVTFAALDLALKPIEFLFH